MKRARLLIAAPAVAAALLLAGCSSDSGEDAATSESVEEAEEAAPEEVVEEEVVEEEVVEEADDGSADVVANAEAVIEAAKAIPSTEDLGEPIDISSLAGTEIISIPIDSALEFYQAGEAAMKAIAEDAGLKYSTFPTDGSPTSFQQGFATAITTGAGAILLNGPLPEQVAPQIAEAQAAGIPVIPIHIQDKSSPPLDITPYEAFAPFNESMRLASLYAVADLGGEPVQALVIDASGTGPSEGMVATITETLANEAPEGSGIAELINIQVPEWSTDIQPAVQSALVKNPDINAVIPIYDSMALFAIPGIKQAGREDLGVYSFNGTPAVMDLISEGILRANLAENPDWVAYVNLDTAFRAMLGVDPTPQASGPLRLIDESNVAETGTPPQSGKGFGEEYPAAYRALWGLS